ncbi:MAG: hypothetical protein P4L45_16155 [Ignavibacteriaceae bacterium]|nr:hypothetical protein [Ignavibacteriaceae bacterium]
MKVKVFFILVLLLVFSQSELFMQQKKNPAEKAQIEGKWATIHNPMEASDLSMEFKPNKDFSYILSSTWHGNYKQDGAKLITSLYVPIYKKYKEDTTTVLVYSDTLVQIGKDKGKEVITKMIRQNDSTNTGAGIIGSWIIDDQDAESSIITYKPSGEFVIKNILKSFKGKYTIKNDTLMVVSEGRMMIKNRFIIDRGQLRLYSPSQSGPITLEKAGK